MLNLKKLYYKLSGRVTYDEAVRLKELYNNWTMFHFGNSLPEWTEEVFKSIPMLESAGHVCTKKERKMMKRLVLNFYSCQPIYKDEEWNEADFYSYQTTMPSTMLLVGKKWRKW